MDFNGLDEDVDLNGLSLSDSLRGLEATKEAMAAKLQKIIDKSAKVRRDIEVTKTQTRRVEDQTRQVNNELNPMKLKSSTIQQNIDRLNSEVDQNRDRVQRMRQELADRSGQEFDAMQQTSNKLQELCQRFLDLKLKCNTLKQTDVSSEELSQIEEEIRDLNDKHSSLMQQINELNVSPKTAADDYRWKDWPIEERMTAMQLLAEDRDNWNKNLDFAKNIKEEQLKQFGDQ